MTELVRDIPIHALNKRCMLTEDIDLLQRWLEEEKKDAKRQFAMTRLYHRISVLMRKRDMAEMAQISREK